MKKLFILLIACLSVLPVLAQTEKNITLSAGTGYTDYLSLSADSKDLDVMLKFKFNETENSITVSLLSYRPLFVFHDDTPFRPAIKRRKLRPQHLTYVVEESPYTVKVPRKFRRRFISSKRKFVFSRWISYEGVQPIPATHNLVNDYIEYSFDIFKNRNELTFGFHHLVVADKDNSRPDKPRLIFSYLADLNYTYHITLQRDPCLGAEEELKQASEALEGVRQSYLMFRDSYQGKELQSEDLYKQFLELKEILVNQYPRREVKAACHEVAACWQEYNTYADSLRLVNCTVYQKPVQIVGVSASLLLEKARQIDSMVTRWINSSDPVEKKDLQALCRKIITEIRLLVEQNGIADDEQQRAWEIFRQADKYYTITIAPSRP